MTKIIKAVEVVLLPGQPLPKGKLVAAWKLSPGHGDGAICLHYEPEDDNDKDH